MTSIHQLLASPRFRAAWLALGLLGAAPRWCWAGCPDPVVSIADALPVQEGDVGFAIAAFDVTIDSDPCTTIQVGFDTQDGSATGGVDYVATDGNFAFVPMGPTTVTIQVEVVGDPDLEPNEDFFVNIFVDPPGVGGDVQGRGVILDDDAPPPTASVSDVTVTEGDAGTVDAVFTVTVEGQISGQFSVDFATNDGSATVADNDYEATSGTLVFLEGPDGVIVQDVVVTVNGDITAENDEFFELNLSNPDGGTIADGQGIGTILNDDALPTLLIDDVMVTEGDAGTVDAVFTVTIAGAFSSTVTVAFASGDGTATVADNDYEAVSGVLTFIPGGPPAQAVTVPVNGDVVNEADETFEVDLSNPNGATIADGQGIGTISNDDALPTLSIDDVMVTEGDTGTVDAVFTVTIAGAFSNAVTVNFASGDGTATVADTDYEAVSGLLTFIPGGPPAQAVTVPVNGDVVNEPDETFEVDLSNPQGGTITDGQGIGTILNDDAVPVISINDVEVAEGDAGLNSAVFTVAISGSFSEPASVRFATHNLTAEVSDDDYDEASGTLVFAPGGATTMNVGVAVHGDTRVELDEQFRVDLLNPQGATLDDHHGVGTILNDDQQPAPNTVRLIPSPPVGEADPSATVTVERLGTGGAAQVTVRFRRGTASPGQDFVAGEQIVSWGAGESGPRTAAVELLDDHRQEDAETIEVVLAAPVGTTLGDPSEIELVLLDDDEPTGLVQLGEPEVVTVINAVAELAVQVFGPQGEPVARAPVAWQASAGGELLLGESTLTNAQGVARQRVRLGTQPGIVTVEATLEATGESVSFRLTAQGDLAALFDSTVNPGEASVAGALDAACVAPVGDFAALCSYVFGLGDTDQGTVVGEMTPRETSAQGTLSLDVGTSQLQGVGARLAALRGGATRAVTEQIAFVFEDRALALQELRYAVARFRDEEAWASERVALALETAAKPAPEHETPPAESPPGEAVDRVSRLGFFLSGRVVFGDRRRTRLEEGFEADLAALTAGLDYRFRDRFVLGGALGYLDTAIDLDADGGGLDAASYSLTGYWSYFREAFYLEGALGYGRNAFKIERHIDLPVPFGGQPRLTAVAEPDGDQLAVSLGLGHDVAFGPASLEGFARASWVDAAIDGYVERGAGPFNLAIRDQDLESLLSEVGLTWSYAASRAWGVLQPMLRAAYLHEFEDDSRLIRGSFVGDVQVNEFLVPTEVPDRDFFNASAGFTATTVRGRSFFLSYDTDLGRDDLDLWALSLGLRLEL